MADVSEATPVPVPAPDKKTALQAMREAAAAAANAATPIVEQATVAAATAAAVAAVTEAAPEVPAVATVVAAVTTGVAEAAVEAAPVVAAAVAATVVEQVPAVTTTVVAAVEEAAHAVEGQVGQWFDTGNIQKRGQTFDGVLAIAKPNFVKVWVRFKEALTEAEKAIVVAGGKRLEALIEVKGDKAEIGFGKTAPEA